MLWMAFNNVVVETWEAWWPAARGAPRPSEATEYMDIRGFVIVIFGSGAHTPTDSRRVAVGGGICLVGDREVTMAFESTTDTGSGALFFLRVFSPTGGQVRKQAGY